MRAVHNRQVDFYVNLCVQLIRDDPLFITQSKNLQRDCETVISRCRAEGLSFVTKSMPLLGRALDFALVSLKFSIPRGFVAQMDRSRPAFMQEYFNLIFDSNGALLEDASPEAVRHLRQVFYFAYKLELPNSRLSELKVINSFEQTEKELALLDLSGQGDLISLAADITSKVFTDFDPLDIVPKHGPGAVATGERGEDKWCFHRKYLSIHRVYPYYDFFVVGGSRELKDRLDWYKSLEVHENGTAKVVLVPKDSRGPRLISCEPLEYQWIQQGLGQKVVRHLESHRLTRDRINFTHQEINQKLAMVGSSHRYWATLDLKDASDRVSLELVRGVFKSTPRLLRALEAARTVATALPDGRVLELRKFAPMGSALCFPVEAFIFWVIMVAEISRATNLPLVRVGEKIHVYGDDIVVPRTWALRCIQALEAVGLLVNRDKSCLSGSFRESCGVDAFKGHLVTPLRLKTQWSGRISDGSALASYTSLANRIGEKGYKGTARLIWEMLSHTYGNIPYGDRRSGYPCHWVASRGKMIDRNRQHFRMRSNAELQRLEFFLPRLAVKRRRSKLDGWPRLMRDMVTPVVGDPSFVVLARSTLIKHAWTPVP